MPRKTINVGRVKGSMWYTGTNPQEVEKPLEGDLYLNENTSIIYIYKNSNWTEITNIDQLVKDTIEENAIKVRSISIGESGSYNVESDEEIPTTKAVQVMIKTKADLGYVQRENAVINEKITGLNDQFQEKWEETRRLVDENEEQIYTLKAGKADLVDGVVPASQLPSYVDDVIEFEKTVDGKQWKENALATAHGSIVFNNTTASNLEGGTTNKYYRVLLQNVDGTEANLKIIKPEAGKIYVVKTSGVTFRWSGSNLVEISKSLALGETSSTAYAGNKGKANADAIKELQETKADISYVDEKTANTGVNEDKVLEIIEENSEEVESLNLEEVETMLIGRSDNYNTGSDSQIPTTKAVQTMIAKLVNSAPSTLDTLKELANALGNDPNFATTVLNKLGEKVDKDYVDEKISANRGVSEEQVTTMIEDAINSSITSLMEAEY